MTTVSFHTSFKLRHLRPPNDDDITAKHNDQSSLDNFSYFFHKSIIALFCWFRNTFVNTRNLTSVGSAGGVISGTGTISIANLVDEGTISVGSSPGVIVIDGDLTQTRGSALDMELAGRTAGSAYDQLRISGQAALAGVLSLSLLDGFEPAVGDSFSLLFAGSITGSFDELRGLVSSRNLVLEVTRTETAIELHGREVSVTGSDGAERPVAP